MTARCWPLVGVRDRLCARRLTVAAHTRDTRPFAVGNSAARSQSQASWSSIDPTAHTVTCDRLSWLVSAFERTLKQHLLSYRIVTCSWRTPRPRQRAGYCNRLCPSVRPSVFMVTFPARALSCLLTGIHFSSRWGKDDELASVASYIPRRYTSEPPPSHETVLQSATQKTS